MNAHATRGLPIPLQIDNSNAIAMESVATTMTAATLAQDVKNEPDVQMYTEVIVNDCVGDIDLATTDAIEATNQQTGTEQFIIFTIPSQTDENVLQQPIMFQY